MTNKLITKVEFDQEFLRVLRMEIDTGSVVMPRPTGKWDRDDQGFWREIYTDEIVLNADGSERSRKPFTSACGIKAEEGAFDENGPTLQRRKQGSLWQRIIRVIVPRSTRHTTS